MFVKKIINLCSKKCPKTCLAQIPKRILHGFNVLQIKMYQNEKKMKNSIISNNRISHNETKH